MDFKDFRAGKDDDSRRLDRIVKRILRESPEINCQEIIRKKLVRINQKKASSDTKVQENDIISIAAFLFEKVKDVKKEKNSSETPKIQVFFQNEHLIIVDKPWGISVQPSSSGEKSVSDIICKLYPGEGSSLSFRTGPLHRLDKNTTGLLVFSQSSLGARWFSQAIKNHEIKKTYVGLAEGHLENGCTWEDFMEEDERKNGFHTMKISGGSGQKAITHANPLAYGRNGMQELTLVQYDIETGRKHQIRCQSAHHGHPLFGDSAYGGNGPRFFLHAAMLRFPENNPLGLPGTIQCPIPGEFKKILDFDLINWNGQLIIFH